MCANRNPYPNTERINPQEKRKQERKEDWVRGPHSLGAGRQRAAGGRGFREREDATGKLPARGGGDRSKDTCCGRLGNTGRGCTQGEGVQVCRGDNQTPSPARPSLQQATPPTMGEAESEGFRTAGHQTQWEDGWTAEKSTGKSLCAEWRCLQLPSPL